MSPRTSPGPAKASKVAAAAERPGPAGEHDAALAAVVARVSARSDEIGLRMIQRYRNEILDYRTLDEDVLYHDVLDISLDNLRSLRANLGSGQVLREEELERSREGAARRVHQGVSLESLLHAFRLWGQLVWEAILDATRLDDRAEREAALRLAGRVLQHTDIVSTAAAQAYLDEAQGVWSDQELVRRDLLDALLSGRGDSEPARQLAGSLRVQLCGSYVVILAHRSDGPTSEVELRPLSARAALRQAVETAKAHLRPPSGSLLVGIRQGEIVALYPIDGPARLDRVKAQCARLADALCEEGVTIGIGGWHPGPAGVVASYSEAREAVEIGIRTGVRGQPIAFDNVLIDHILQSSQHSDRLLADTLGPLREYDAQRHTDLIPTLQAYFDAGFNLTRSAAKLCVHPNTVVYRLKRIKELTGRDPHEPDDLLLLSLGLKIVGLEATTGERAGPVAEQP